MSVPLNPNRCAAALLTAVLVAFTSAATPTKRVLLIDHDERILLASFLVLEHSLALDPGEAMGAEPEFYREQVDSPREEVPWCFVGTITFVIVQVFLILGLLVHRQNKKRGEASLREVTGRLLHAQDEERRRFARDLHDGTAQHLTGMALAIGQVIAKFPPGFEPLRKLLEESHVACRQALDEVRTVSYALHPPILDGVGLVAALRWYLDGLQKRTHLKVEFEAPVTLKHLSPEAERALFRISQESITNVLQHSGGTSIRVNLANSEEAVTLEIEDDGRGMSSDQLAQSEAVATLGVGIAGMRERIRQLNGTFKIRSCADGTKVRATVPVERGSID